MPTAIDFETFYAKNYSIRGSIAESYCSDSRFDAYMVSASDGRSCWAGHPKDFNWDAIDGETVLAHNARFDKTVFEELQRRCLIPSYIQPKEWLCTADMSTYICGRRALDDALEHLLNLKISKAVRSDAKGKQWPVDFSEVEQKAMIEYARNDAFYCWTLFDRFGARWPSTEQKLSKLTCSQGQRGVAINTDLLEEYIIETHTAKMKTQALLPWLEDTWDEEGEFDNSKPTSTKCIAEQCRRKGIPCPPVKKEDEEGFDEWEKTYSRDNPWIPALSAWRSINATYKKLLMVKARLRNDNTLPFALKYFGAHTGRWSGDAGINFQNFRKLPIIIGTNGYMEPNERLVTDAVDAHAETGNWPAWVHAAIDFRALIIPRPGKKMIVSDLAQIEPRVLAWLTKDWALLDLIKTGMSIYEAHARATMGWTGGKLKDEDPGTYKLAKARILGLGYGCGWEKFIAMAYDLARLDITKDDPELINMVDDATGKVTAVPGWGKYSKEVVEAFRSDNPSIAGDAGIWRRLEGGLRSSVSSDFVVTLPNGRKMTYGKVRCEMRVEPDKVTGRPKKNYVYTADIGGERKITYGGKLTENVTQAVARDVMGEQLVRMTDAGLGCLFSVHDEAVMEVDQDVTTKDVEHHMSFCPDWLPGCPVGAEANEAICYKK